jgi:hypothetical protein
MNGAWKDSEQHKLLVEQGLADLFIRQRIRKTPFYIIGSEQVNAEAVHETESRRGVILETNCLVIHALAIGWSVEVKTQIGSKTNATNAVLVPCE